VPAGVHQGLDDSPGVPNNRWLLGSVASSIMRPSLRSISSRRRRIRERLSARVMTLTEGIPAFGCWGASPATAPLAVARPTTQSTQSEMISAVLTTYRQNEARFRHEYVGRLFSARMRLSRVSESVIGETTRVDFGSVHCNLARGSNRAIIAWNKGDEIEISGIIKDIWFGSVELERCSLR
jgi:hypothetical protein